MAIRRMQNRRGSAADWTAANPILAAGEMGFETDTNRIKIGTGTAAWNDIKYYGEDDFAERTSTGAKITRQKTLQTIPSNTQTSVEYDTVVYDTGGISDIVNRAQTLVATKAGVWLAVGSITISQASTTGIRRINFTGNNTSLATYHGINAINGDLTRMVISEVGRINLNDTVGLQAYQNSGMSLDIRGSQPWETTLSLTYLGAY